MSAREPSRAEVPEAEALTVGLREVLGDPEVVVVDRERNAYASTFPSEIVTCRMGDGASLRLLCKYHNGGRFRDDGHGHRGGIAYEAEVYREVVAPVAPSAVRCFGTHNDVACDTTWLVLEYLDGACSLRKSPDPDAIVKAARWIGQFHAAQESRLDDGGWPDLIRYDALYYTGWARRTAEYAVELHHTYPWVAVLCERFVALLQVLTAAPPTVVHGEYYPQNILVRDGVVYPIDWESAAIGSGEIDLAALTDRWPAEVTRQCESAYREARWPAGPPPEHRARLSMARIYIQLRWLGDRNEFIRVGDSGLRWRFAALQALGRDLALG